MSHEVSSSTEQRKLFIKSLDLDRPRERPEILKIRAQNLNIRVRAQTTGLKTFRDKCSASRPEKRGKYLIIDIFHRAIFQRWWGPSIGPSSHALEAQTWAIKAYGSIFVDLRCFRPRKHPMNYFVKPNQLIISAFWLWSGRLISEGGAYGGPVAT